MQKIYIVTGATGFVGGVLTKKLLEKNETVHAFIRCEKKAALVLGKDTNAKLFIGDVKNFDDMDKLFCVPDAEYIVIHTAAVVLIHGTKKEYADMRETNIQGVQNIIDLCLKHNAKLIHISSVHAITEPPKKALTTEISDFDSKKVHGHYAKTKAEGSRMVLDAVKNRKLNAVMVHPGGIVGPYDYGNSHLTQMVTDYLAGKIPAATKGGYNFVDVRDVADGTLAAEKSEAGECFLLTNKYYSVREMLDLLHELSGGKKIKTTLPMWAAKMGLPFLSLGAKIKKSRPLYTSYSLYTLNSNSNYSHEKASKEFGYTPRELKESLKDTLEFLEELTQN
ncbi:MAG: NAD-dependent epimerase/dehydratase family protein [Firmicutes bacterium]|nr:NAD-dependent epimerase/dehydratase family protein [Bacillota bacterium]